METPKTFLAVQSSSSFKDSVKVAARLRKGGQSLASQLYVHIKIKGHGGHFVCPISNLTGHLAALIFVDDTYLIHINIKAEETVTVSHQAIQYSISNWGQLIIPSGGAFKPPKCFYHLISFSWNTDGSWTYENVWKTSI